MNLIYRLVSHPNTQVVFHSRSFMTSNYAYTPSIWPSVFTLLLLIALVAYSCNRRSVPGATPFMVACLFAAAWAAASLMEVAAGVVQTQDLLV